MACSSDFPSSVQQAKAAASSATYSNSTQALLRQAQPHVGSDATIQNPKDTAGDLRTLLAVSCVQVGSILTACAHLPVEATRAQQRRVQNVRPVGRRDDDDASVTLKAVHLRQQLVERLLALVVAAADACSVAA